MKQTKTYHRDGDTISKLNKIAALVAALLSEADKGQTPNDSTSLDDRLDTAVTPLTAVILKWRKTQVGRR